MMAYFHFKRALLDYIANHPVEWNADLALVDPGVLGFGAASDL